MAPNGIGMYDLHIATIGVIGANVLVSLRGFTNPVFFDRYKFHIGAIRSGQGERMLTSGFLHVDFSHMFFNMFTLYFFADGVIRWLGAGKFLILYLVSLLAGSLLALFFHRKEPYYSAVGASGAVTGILYGAILLNPAMQLGILFIPIPLPAYVFGIAYLLYAIYGMRNRHSSIGHTAHFGGAIGGYATTLLFRPELFVTDTFVVLLLAVPIGILFALEKMGKL